MCNRLDTPNNPLPHDNYLSEVLEIAHQLQEREPRFTLASNQQLVQGKPNRVLRARYDEQPIILKSYGDHWNVPGPGLAAVVPLLIGLRIRTKKRRSRKLTASKASELLG